MLKRFIKEYFDPEFDIRVQAFNLLGFVGVVAGLVSALTSALYESNLLQVVLNLMASTIGFFMLRFAKKTGLYRICFLITVILIFIIIFPILFFIGGGYLGGMPLFFIFAFIFTSLMLEGKIRVVFIIFEFIIYIACFFGYYLFADSFIIHVSIFDIMNPILTRLIVSSSLLLVVIQQYMRIYNNQRKRLAEFDRLKTEFLGIMSHELKTPLTIMSGYAQISQKFLSGVPEMENVENYVKLIASEADRLALMVGQLLDVTRIEEGRMAMHTKPSSIMEIVQDTVSTYSSVFGKNNNKLSMAGIPDLPFVLCDGHRVAQVLVNLISNAARHTADGTITITAEEQESPEFGVRSSAPNKNTSGFVRVAIADTGEGIAPERLSTIFDRFKSGADGKTPPGRESGTGLGLYICRFIVEAHGGTIGIESAPGVGTMVWFTIPIA